MFGGFILAFFIELTGRSLHEIIGVAAGFVAAYHLFTHWDWISAVTRRYFGKTSGQSRLYYLIDTALLTGFFTILFSGMVIAHWISLPLAGSHVWKTVHVTASVATLLVTFLKLALHWRWIASTVRKLLPLQALAQGQRSTAQTVPVEMTQTVTRREG